MSIIGEGQFYFYIGIYRKLDFKKNLKNQLTREAESETCVAATTDIVYSRLYNIMILKERMWPQLRWGLVKIFT